MSVGTGNATAVRSGWDQQFDPASGWVTVETWKGTKPQIAVIAPVFRGAGAKVGVSNDGALWTLVATWSVELSQNLNDLNPSVPPGQVFVGEVPTEIWNVNVELVQVDLRVAPGVRSLFGLTTRGDEILAGAFALAEDAIKARETPVEYLRKRAILPIEDALLLSYMQVYRLKARGVNAVEEKRIVLSRNRSYSTRYPLTNRSDAKVGRVYYTSTLIDSENVPKTIQEILPSKPPVTLTEAQWGWKQRRQDTNYNAARNRIDDNSDWVFAQWSDVIYKFL